MASGDLTMGVVFLTQTVVGILGNFCLLFSSLCLYCSGVGRGMSFSSTCLLSVFQAITISPRDSRWAELQVKAPRYTGTSVFLCWILHLLVNIIVPVHVTVNRGTSRGSSTSMAVVPPAGPRLSPELLKQSFFL
ncbi:Hypothetical predicted protein [Marmota monax]|uniref:Vomeronasal type-1 receptor n=1 Tax=Marmota monax TaxID=9995 RepID=A0A5E4CW62_MARMO|nr:Hypothetical predicted protein [Marmota monax]